MLEAYRNKIVSYKKHLRIQHECLKLVVKQIFGGDYSPPTDIEQQVNTYYENIDSDVYSGDKDILDHIIILLKNISNIISDVYDALGFSYLFDNTGSPSQLTFTNSESNTFAVILSDITSNMSALLNNYWIFPFEYNILNANKSVSLSVYDVEEIEGDPPTYRYTYHQHYCNYDFIFYFTAKDRWSSKVVIYELFKLKFKFTGLAGYNVYFYDTYDDPEHEGNDYGGNYVKSYSSNFYSIKYKDTDFRSMVNWNSPSLSFSESIILKCDVHVYRHDNNLEYDSPHDIYDCYLNSPVYVSGKVSFVEYFKHFASVLNSDKSVQGKVKPILDDDIRLKKFNIIK